MKIVALVTIAMLSTSSAMAQNPVASGVPMQTHAGVNIFCFPLDAMPGVWFYLPNTQVLQGVSVSNAKHSHSVVQFHYDPNQSAPCHNPNNVPAFLVNDVDDLP